MCDICRKATRKCRPQPTKIDGGPSGRVFFEALTKQCPEPALKFEWNNTDYFHYIRMPIKFCPFCGEELKKED